MEVPSLVVIVGMRSSPLLCWHHSHWCQHSATYFLLISGPKLSPAGALSVVLAPTRKESGLIDPPVICCLRSYDATPKGELALMAASSPFTNAIPLGAARLSSKVFLTLTSNGLIVVSGVGSPVVVIWVGPNLTRVKGELALLDHRSPAVSNTSAHGPWIDPWPSSLRTTSGVRFAIVPRPIPGR